MASVIHSDPEILGGTPVFVGTRVPLKTLIDSLEAGRPLADFPSVSREQAVAASSRTRRRSSLMRVLPDECLPRGLKLELTGHDAKTGVVVLGAPRNDIDTLRPLTARVRAALERMHPGDVLRIES